MGEGQKPVSKASIQSQYPKPVSKAYKDNWNDIFGKKKKR